MNASKVGSTTIVSRTVYSSYPILPFGIVICTFFLTTFLEIAVYFIVFLPNLTVSNLGSSKIFLMFLILVTCKNKAIESLNFTYTANVKQL